MSNNGVVWTQAEIAGVVVTESDVEGLLMMADMLVEMVSSFAALTTRDWERAEMRMAEIATESAPLLEAYKVRWGEADADERAPALHESPLDGAAWPMQPGVGLSGNTLPLAYA